MNKTEDTNEVKEETKESEGLSKGFDDVTVSGYTLFVVGLGLFWILFWAITSYLQESDKVDSLILNMHKQDVAHIKALNEKDVQLTRLVGKAENIELRGELELQKCKSGIDTLKSEYRGIKNEYNVYKQFHPVAEGVKDARP